MKRYIVEVSCVDGTSYGFQSEYHKFGNMVIPEDKIVKPKIDHIKVTINDKYEERFESPRDRPTYP
jgi:hypothetical protein